MSGHPCLVPDLGRNALFFAKENVVCWWFIIGGLHVEVGSLYVHFLQFLSILSKAFSASIRNDRMVFILQFVNMVCDTG